MAQSVTHTVTQVKGLPFPSVKRLLREAGYSMSDVARRRGIYPSTVSRTIRKQVVSAATWSDVVWCLNHPRNGT